MAGSIGLEPIAYRLTADCSTIELTSHQRLWRGSNSRPLAWQANALTIWATEPWMIPLRIELRTTWFGVWFWTWTKISDSLRNTLYDSHKSQVRYRLRYGIKYSFCCPFLRLVWKGRSQLVLWCTWGATIPQSLMAWDFKQKLMFLDYLITFNITWSGSGRSSWLLSGLTTPVVSTRSLELSKASLALHVPQHFNRIQPLVRYVFLHKGDSLILVLPCVCQFRHRCIYTAEYK